MNETILDCGIIITVNILNTLVFGQISMQQYLLLHNAQHSTLM